jgi:hypothetical protein
VPGRVSASQPGGFLDVEKAEKVKKKAAYLL